MRDDFAKVAEWVRREKLDIIRRVPEGTPPILNDCILCLRRGQHQYSVKPDMDSDHPWSALTWSTACLGCDEYFWLSDDGERVVVQRFTLGDAHVDATTGYPVDPPYPTTASYHYEQQGTTVIWGHVSDKDVERFSSTWELWHASLAGWKIESGTMPDVIQALRQKAVKEGMTAKDRDQTEYQGRARFVSTCEGVKAVMCSNMAAAGLNALIAFQDGEAYRA
jgi:hypothetical protein